MKEDDSLSVYLKKLYKNSSIVTDKMEKPVFSVLDRLSSFFTPGEYYFYIIDFNTLEVSNVSEGTEDIIGYNPSEVNIELLLSLVDPKHYSTFKKIEALADRFFSERIEPQDVPFYKAVYPIPIITKDGSHKILLHQGLALGASENGEVQYVLNVHMDATYLNPKNSLSMVGLNGRPSYYNIDPDKPDFNGSHHNEIFSEREIEIIELISKGFTNNEIAEKLHISSETIRTHRKNILRKCDCKNFPELIAFCIRNGII